MRRYGPVVFLMATAFGGTAAAQSMVGYGLGAAGASTATAPARGIGKTMGKAWENTGKTVKSETPGTVSRRSRSTRTSTESKAKAAPLVNYEDPGKIEAGLTYADLIRRFGPPSMQITAEDGACTLTYLGKGVQAELVVKDSKVGSVAVHRVQQAALPR
jgi:hypothetical protein